MRGEQRYFCFFLSRSSVQHWRAVAQAALVEQRSLSKQLSVPSRHRVRSTAPPQGPLSVQLYCLCIRLVWSCCGRSCDGQWERGRRSGRRRGKDRRPVLRSGVACLQHRLLPQQQATTTATATRTAATAAATAASSVSEVGGGQYRGVGRSLHRADHGHRHADRHLLLERPRWSGCRPNIESN